MKLTMIEFNAIKVIKDCKAFKAITHISRNSAFNGIHTMMVIKDTIINDVHKLMKNSCSRNKAIYIILQF